MPRGKRRNNKDGLSRAVISTLPGLWFMRDRSNTFGCSVCLMSIHSRTQLYKFWTRQLAGADISSNWMICYLSCDQDAKEKKKAKRKKSKEKQTEMPVRDEGLSTCPVIWIDPDFTSSPSPLCFPTPSCSPSNFNSNSLLLWFTTRPNRQIDLVASRFSRNPPHDLTLSDDQGAVELLFSTSLMCILAPERRYYCLPIKTFFSFTFRHHTCSHDVVYYLYLVFFFVAGAQVPSHLPLGD